MKKDIILAGVGGQGILSIAAIIGYAAVESDLYLKQAEVHGMSQRGGDVQSHLRISDSVIYSDLIPTGKADMIIAVEPMEGLRYKSYLAKEGWLLVNTKPYLNIPNYPDLEALIGEIESLPHKISLNADKIAKELDSPRSMNMVMLGTAIPFLDLEYEKIKQGVKYIFGRKGDDIVTKNLKAVESGRELAEKNRI